MTLWLIVHPRIQSSQCIWIISALSSNALSKQTLQLIHFLTGFSTSLHWFLSLNCMFVSPLDLQVSRHKINFLCGPQQAIRVSKTRPHLAHFSWWWGGGGWRAIFVGTWLYKLYPHVAVQYSTSQGHALWVQSSVLFHVMCVGGRMGVFVHVLCVCVCEGASKHVCAHKGMHPSLLPFLRASLF